MISKKRLLEIEKLRKEKLYSRGSGKRNIASAGGKTGIMIAAFALIFGAGFLIFYSNSIAPVKKKTVETKAEVVVVEEQKEVGVIEELKVQLHPALRKKAEEALEKQDKVNLTFYDDLSKAESSPLTIEEKVEEKPETALSETKAVEKVPVTPEIKEKKIVVKSVVKNIVKNAVQLPKKKNKPVASGPRDYRIQIASFRDEAEAKKRRQQLSQDGFNAVAETIDLGTKGVWHRVYVDDYTSRENAKGDLNKIAKKYKIKPFIVKKP